MLYKAVPFASDQALSLSNRLSLQKKLNQARIGLLSYALSYADNYRASGAGPGHLPCPDTDPPDDGNPGNDGPNPPCGQLVQSAGRIPRLIHLDSTSQSGAKVIDIYPPPSLQDRQPWYVVSGDMINNPINRVINSASFSAAATSGEDGVLPIALLIEPGPVMRQRGQWRPSTDPADYLEGSYSLYGAAGHGVNPVNSSDIEIEAAGEIIGDSNDLTVPLYWHTLLPLLERRVAGFAIDWLQDYHQNHCPEAGPLQATIHRRGSLQQSVSAETTNISPTATLAEVTADNTADNAVTHCFPYAAAQGSHLCHRGLLEGSLALEIGSCSAALATNGKLDGVSVPRHWYMRNQWHRHIRYRLDGSCISASTISCEIIVLTGGADPGIELHISPAPPVFTAPTS